VRQARQGEVRDGCDGSFGIGIRGHIKILHSSWE
jgi:hypothetical protein